MKIIEHYFWGDETVLNIERYLTPQGQFHNSRVVWAGDYADPEPGYDISDDEYGESQPNLYQLLRGTKLVYIKNPSLNGYHYIVNHSKHQFVDKRCSYGEEQTLHPLPLLTAEGYGSGWNEDNCILSGQDKIGIWARDILSVEKEAPADYAELKVMFHGF